MPEQPSTTAQIPAHLTAEQLQAIAHAIADPRRFAMLQQIAKQPDLACTGLCARGVLAAATISHHLKVLTQAGLIDVVREGRGVRLSLRRDTWSAFLKRLGEL